jgi:hypothetical protein
MMNPTNTHEPIHEQDDGELTLEELAQIAGGQAGFDSSLPQFSMFQGDVQVVSTDKVEAKADSSYTSYIGAAAEPNTFGHIRAIPLNLSQAFP